MNYDDYCMVDEIEVEDTKKEGKRKRHMGQKALADRNRRWTEMTDITKVGENEFYELEEKFLDKRLSLLDECGKGFSTYSEYKSWAKEHGEKPVRLPKWKVYTCIVENGKTLFPCLNTSSGDLEGHDAKDKFDAVEWLEYGDEVNE